MREKGFTLVELAIVLVIIGIILGGILKGQAVIENARIKRIQKDMSGLEAAIWTFYDRYGRMPGDGDKNGIIDASVTARLDNNPNKTLLTSRNPDGDAPWAELKYARILSENADTLDLAQTQFGAQFHIGYAREGRRYANAIAIINLPCFVAKALDSAIDGQLDAGVGRIRQLNGYTVENTSDNWSACNNDENTPVSVAYFYDREP